ncbi:hypothetical protein Poly30_16050 [Planctomycetes bacterium Poly30]|uniref:Uncharacterized protein n=1 Tax=Saltatorellus ferox TaxID=2528018 RepID=A0A518EPT9_9BACT|nr:hypothetical protein Poly30_16050 [Planctomycetes bacterium Poly30]
MIYSVDSGKVRHAGKVVRGADATTFRVLEVDPSWALDARQVYFSGRKVAGASPSTFVAFGNDVAADGRRLFYRLSGREQLTSKARPKAFAGDVEVLRDDVHLVLKVAGEAYVAAPHGIGEPLPVDADSFLLLGCGYARDEEHIYWFDLHRQPLAIPGADLATFAVVGAVASDRHGRFLNGMRIGEPLPVEREADPSAALKQRITGVLAMLLPRYFALFDTTLPNDGPAASPMRGTPTEVPAHTVELDGASVILRVGRRSYSGRVSCLELIASWLYAVAWDQELEGATCLRVLPTASRWPHSPSDPSPLWHRQLDLAYLLEALGEHDESRLLVDQVRQEQRACPRTKDLATDPRLRMEKLLPEVLLGLPEPVIAEGSTTPSAAARMVKENRHRAEDPVIRRGVADEFLALVRATSLEPARLAEASASLASLLEDPVPAVRVRAAVAFDLAASKLCYYRAYEPALDAVRALAAGGFNLDLQLARQWECLVALGQNEAAEEAWRGAVLLDKRGGRRPRQHTGLHTDYPSLEVWRAFAELRLAEADAQGARAADRIAEATATMERLAAEAPAAMIGMSLAEFAEQRGRVTGEGQVEAHGFMMHGEFVDYRRYGVPYECTGAEIEFEGEFESTGDGLFRPLHPGSEVPCSLGRAFGLEYRFAGGPPGRRLTASVRVERPVPGAETRVDDYPVLVFLGLRENFVFLLESPDELTPGEWKITVTLFSAAAPRTYPRRGKLTPDSPIASIQHTFQLVEPGE